jgi:large subunit ribosomal protein L9
VPDIAAAVKAAGGPVLDRRAIATEGHIRETGKHAVTVELHPDVTAKITVKVVAA